MSIKYQNQYLCPTRSPPSGSIVKVVPGLWQHGRITGSWPTHCMFGTCMSENPYVIPAIMISLCEWCFGLSRCIYRCIYVDNNLVRCQDLYAIVSRPSYTWTVLFCHVLGSPSAYPVIEKLVGVCQQLISRWSHFIFEVQYTQEPFKLIFRKQNFSNFDTSASFVSESKQNVLT